MNPHDAARDAARAAAHDAARAAAHDAARDAIFEHAIARAVRDEDWDRVALYTIARFLDAARRLPGASIDDLVAAITRPEHPRERPRR